MKKTITKVGKFILPIPGVRNFWIKIAVYVIIAIIYILKQLNIIHGDIEGLIQAILHLFGL